MATAFPSACKQGDFQLMGIAPISVQHCIVSPAWLKRRILTLRLGFAIKNLSNPPPKCKIVSHSAFESDIGKLSLPEKNYLPIVNSPFKIRFFFDIDAQARSLAERGS